VELLGIVLRLKETGRTRRVLVACCFVLLLQVVPLRAQDRSTQSNAQGASNNQQASPPSNAELAKEEKNPFANLFQVQIENDFGFGGDTGDRLQYEMTLRPVIPININNSWNLITRSTFSVSSMPESDSGAGRITGASDLATEFYFSPDKANPFFWGFGPVLGIPTASDISLGTGKWTLGPGFAVIKQTEHWQYGVLVNHVWSFAGDKNRGNVSSTFIQPGLYYTWGNGWTLGLDAESTYDSMAAPGERWTVPVQASITRVTNLPRLPISLSLGVIPYAVAPAGSPSISVNFTIALLFPRKGR